MFFIFRFFFFVLKWATWKLVLTDGFSDRIKITVKLIKSLKTFTMLGWIEYHRNEENLFQVLHRLLKENLSYAEIREILKKSYANVQGFSVHSINTCWKRNGLLSESLILMSMKSFFLPPVTTRVLFNNCIFIY